MSFSLILYEPLIPSNTGSIGRLCVNLGIKLHLIEPLGFSLSDSKLKRAGLDYWPRLDYETHDSIPGNLNGRVIAFTTKGDTSLWDVNFQKNDFLLFGREDIGLPEEVKQNSDLRVRIPMIPNERSLNLAMSVSVASYEALRQLRKNAELKHM
ncbi:RNA methyltransferase [bacterium]|nr:RNA methyltransferase [bacterium]